MQFKMLQVNLAVLSFAIIVGVDAAPAPVDEVKIDNYLFKSLDDQNVYKFYYMLSDGQERIEEGKFERDANGDEKFVVSGSYDYIGPDGVLYSIFYIADENGFQPYGEHLPGADELDPLPEIAEEELPTADIEPNAIKSLIG